MADDMQTLAGAEPVRIVFLDRGTLGPDAVLRSPSFPHQLDSFERTAADEVAARIAHAEILIVNKAPVTAAALDAAPKLRLIAVAATGYNNIDIEACRQRGIAVSNIRGYAGTTVPEHVFALILALRRSLCSYRDAVRGGRWQEAGQFCFFDYPIDDLAGSTLGIVGGGELGSAVGRIGQAFGMHVQYAGRKGAGAPTDRVEFDRFLRTSDVISLHCPFVPGSGPLLSDPEFAAMERRPLLINTGRGGLIDDAALVRALDLWMIAGAGIDVADAEPPAPDHPLMMLANRPNVVLTPHVGWASRQAVQALADQLADNIEAFMRGETRNAVV